jgi:hypothetical protein
MIGNEPAGIIWKFGPHALPGDSFRISAKVIAQGVNRENHENALAAVLGLIALAAPRAVRADTFTVHNTLDAGPGSLRAVIAALNALGGPGPNVIDFDMPGGGRSTLS